MPMETCGQCSGSGRVPSGKSDSIGPLFETCPLCKGSGQVDVR